ncbi:MAG: beta-galactosidase [Capsulimonadaceae bacterium]|nr:beta-galactosidase [Capsulimonadaceae bacterium]
MTNRISRRQVLAAGIGAAASVALPNRLFAEPAIEPKASQPAAGPLTLAPVTSSEIHPVVRIPMGASHDPAGHEIAVDSVSLLRDGVRWLPTSGECHFSRLSANDWRTELLKMKAGGLEIVATYIFWIHHEEIEGAWRWEGDRDLRHFLQTAAEVGLHAIVRIGPWAHGECRNGGFPDWLVKSGCKLRTTDDAFLSKVNVLYQQVGEQCRGLLFKDGGPIIGIQVDNEYSGPPEYMMTLKKMAIDAGFDVPLYTRTGWTHTKPDLPFGALVPLSGNYPDGFWDRTTQRTTGYRNAYLFSHHRAETGLGAEVFGAATNTQAEAVYPFLCCELGGGMTPGYHRRILVEPMDVAAIVLVMLGNGNNLQGFYMYHGGANPDGQLSTLNESQASGYPNELPVKSYEFQSPLGEFGQIRGHYHFIRRLSLLQQHFGEQLASMTTSLPEKRAHGITDLTTLRWALRSKGGCGFLFVNNYQRFDTLSAKQDVQFALALGGATLTIPSSPVTIPSGTAFVWPCNMEFDDVHLSYATAQPIAQITTGDARYVFFAQVGGIPAEFAFPGEHTTVRATGAQTVRSGDTLIVRGLKPGRDVAIEAKGQSGRTVRFVLLSDDDSLQLWEGKIGGQDRIVLASGGIVFDGKTLRHSGAPRLEHRVSVFPSLPAVQVNGKRVKTKRDGVFAQFVVKDAAPSDAKVVSAVVHAAGPARVVPIGPAHVAQQPSDADFEAGAVWKLAVTLGDSSRSHLLRIRYTGDAARLYSGDYLIDDNFYNGAAFEIGLDRYASLVAKGGLTLKILPLRKDAPIYLEGMEKIDFGPDGSIVRLEGVEIAEEGHHAIEL